MTDRARGIVLVGKKGKGDGYALGHTKTYSIMQIAKAFGGPVKQVSGYAGRAEARKDYRKARALGWHPTVDMMDHIKDFVGMKRPGSTRAVDSRSDSLHLP